MVFIQRHLYVSVQTLYPENLTDSFRVLSRTVAIMANTSKYVVYIFKAAFEENRQRIKVIHFFICCSMFDIGWEVRTY